MGPLRAPKIVPAMKRVGDGRAPITSATRISAEGTANHSARGVGRSPEVSGAAAVRGKRLRSPLGVELDRQPRNRPRF